MTSPKNIHRPRFFWFFLIVAVVLFLSVMSSGVGRAQAQRGPGRSKDISTLSLDGLLVQDLTTSLTPTQLAESLVGAGVTISDVSYTGVLTAAGSFSGGDGIIGFDEGVILSSGLVTNVVGPNIHDGISSDNDAPGDSDLTALAGSSTQDASILEFDFVPAENTVFFRFVFASDEYNEFVNFPYNDVFAFYINGENCARVEDDPVSISTINYGKPYGTAPYSHPELYINNDLQDGGPFLNTEMDGLTHILTCSAPVNAGESNHLKLAIADAGDPWIDSNVFIKSTSLTSASAIELTGLEVTQAVQDLTNDVELVKGKTTYVRAHVKSASGTTVFNVESRLIGRRDGTPIGASLTPMNLGGNLDVLGSPLRQSLSQSFYFRLPPSWTSGIVELEFVGVSHEIECKEVASTGNDCKVSVAFLETPRLKLSLLGVPWKDSVGTLHGPDVSDYAAVVQDIEAQLPIHDLDWNIPYELNDWVADGGPPDKDAPGQWTLSDVLSKLADMRTLDGVTDRIYYGLLVDHTSGADLGLGNRPGWHSAGFYRAADPSMGSHEIGHNLNRQHITCTGEEASPDPAYPYADGHISEADTGNEAYYGLNIFTEAIMRPNVGDLMGFCRPRWVSDYTYEAMRSRIDSVWLALDKGTTIAAAGDPAVLVSGFINRHEITGTIKSVLQVEAPGDIMLPAAGDYKIRFEDAAGKELAAYSFNPDLSEDEPGAPGMYSFLFPWNPSTARVVLLHGETELAVNGASNNAPSITVSSPQAGATWNNESETVSWTASDMDGDKLNYTVQYRTDGGSPWMTLTTAYESKIYTVIRTKLPGSTNAQVRVLVTDGFHTASDIVGDIAVAANAPETMIIKPGSGELFVEEQSIFLEGTAYDTEDGKLSGGSLAWSSQIDGPLGVGELLLKNATDLTEGEHQITLVATDSDGQKSQATTSINVYLVRPAELPRQMAVAPPALSFIVLEGSGPGSGQIASVDNIGDGTIEWTAAADKPWIILSRTSGFSSETFEISVDPASLTSGEYEGKVTVTGAGSLASPQIIDVFLLVYQEAAAAMNADPEFGPPPLVVSFNNMSTGNYNAILWDFGDETSSTVENPQHKYAKAGEYTVELTIGGGFGGTDSVTGIIVVKEISVIEVFEVFLPAVMK